MRLSPLVRTALLVAILAGVFFRLYHLDRKVLWEDEIIGTVRALGYTEAQIVATSPQIADAAGLQQYFHPATSAAGGDRLSDTIRSLALEDPQHPPLYYVLSHAWMDRFGSSVATIRLLPALFGILAIPMAFWFTLELFGSKAVAWTSATLVALSPFHVLYAQEAREYSLWTLAILSCGLAFLRARRLMTTAAWVTYAFAAAASLYVFPFSGFVLAGQGASIVWVPNATRRRALARFAAASAFAALAFGPWLYLMLTNAAMGRGLGKILTVHLTAPTIAGTLAKNLRASFFDLGAAHAGSRAAGLAIAASTVVALILAASAIVFLVRRAPAAVSSYVIFALCFPAIPLVLSDLFRHGMLVAQSRYFTPFYLGVEFAIAYFLCAQVSDERLAPWRRRAFAAAGAGIIACGFVSCLVSSRADTWWNKDYEQNRDVAATINEASKPLVVESVNSSRALGLAYYLKPSVKLALRLTCDNCDGRRIAYAPGTAVASGEYSDVFLVGSARRPFPRSPVALSRDGSGPRYRTVGIAVYPVAAEPLGMFRAI